MAMTSGAAAIGFYESSNVNRTFKILLEWPA